MVHCLDQNIYDDASCFFFKHSNFAGSRFHGGEVEHRDKYFSALFWDLMLVTRNVRGLRGAGGED